ncbi:hypothetical protein [Thalassiella azotivora]
MSREVLGAADGEPPAGAGVGSPSAEARADVVLLDQPDPAPDAAARERGRPSTAPDAAEASGTASAVAGQPDRTDGADGADGAGPTPTGLRRHLPRDLRSAWPLVAAAAAGALVAGLVTAGVLQDLHTQERLAGVRLLADVGTDVSISGSGDLDAVRSGERPIDLSMAVYNAGLDPVRVLSAHAPEPQDRPGSPSGPGTSLDVAEEVLVPAGATVQVPVQVRLRCDGPRPRTLVLDVRTEDGRTRTVEPGGLGQGGGWTSPMTPLWWLCDLYGDELPLRVWTATAQDDGTLAVRLANTGDERLDVALTAPTGTRLTVDGQESVAIAGRDSVFVRLAVEVDRCTAAAQRPDAADDVGWRTPDGRSSQLPVDLSLLSGWFARQVALTCDRPGG